MKVIVSQLSARHNYAIPRMLHAHGILERFYTDLAFPSIIPRVLQGLHLPEKLTASIARRVVEGVPPHLIHQSLAMTVQLYREKARAGHGDFGHYSEVDRAFGNISSKWGTGQADTVYGVAGSGSTFWTEARAKGLKVAADIIITPMFHRIVRDETNAFPDWSDSAAPSQDLVSISDQLNLDSILSADMLICPSVGVSRDIEVFAQSIGLSAEKLPRRTVVGYGIRIPTDTTSFAIPGRILFAGGADVRKGIHYFAEASHLLGTGQHSLEFVVAGGAPDKVRKHPRANKITFLGHLSRDKLYAEYAKADVLVLPTLAEGSATVVHEALAFGVPVVTTLSAGSVVEHGREGAIVPERDIDALAEAIVHIVTDRVLRAYQAAEARKTSLKFDEGPWAKRIIGALQSMHGLRSTGGLAE
jgi:glycosyltransferase involved in cell wall biosynthesis